MVSNGRQRSTDLTYKQDFREDHLAARGDDLLSQRGSRRFESAHLHAEIFTFYLDLSSHLAVTVPRCSSLLSLQTTLR